MGRQIFVVVILTALTTVLLTVAACNRTSEGDEEQFHIALVGPISGKSASAGKSHLQGIQLYIDNINQSGGIRGKKIQLDIFDDQNNKKKAKEMALEVVMQGRALAVIGHNYSSSSINAGIIYKEYQIPAVSPSSTDVKVTLENEWYFRTVLNNNLQGRFLANYVHKLLKQDRVIIVSEDLTYGACLAGIFLMTSKELGMEITDKYQFKVKDPNLEGALQQVVDDIKSKQNTDPIFLATHATEGVKFIKLMKDAGIKNPVIAPNAFATQSFQKGFENSPKEKALPGYYTDGIYVTTPLIFDTANEKAQEFREAYRARYNEEPDWHAAYSYDTAMLICTALKNSAIRGNPDSIREDRRMIKEYLSGLSSIHQAVEGVTGFNFFDTNGDASKAVPIGIYKNGNIISSHTQLQTMRPLGQDALEKAIKDERVLHIDGKYMYKTNVVYTGIDVNDISDIDMKKLTYTLDFNIWFRTTGDIGPQRIKFLNAVEPITLDTPINKKIDGQMHYTNYHVKGRFKADYLSGRYTFGQHVLGISFLHQDMPRNNLIFVTDVLGMGLTNGESITERLKQRQVLHHAHGWSINQVKFYQDTIEKGCGSLATT